MIWIHQLYFLILIIILYLLKFRNILHDYFLNPYRNNQYIAVVWNINVDIYFYNNYNNNQICYHNHYDNHNN